MNSDKPTATSHFSNYFLDLQDAICKDIESVDKESKFQTDQWQRDANSNISDGGGRTRVLEGQGIFEKAGVNFSNVSGTLPENMSKTLTGDPTPQKFSACGISLVIHPYSPLLPTTHANVRYLEVGELAWFGGGMDLTPYYLPEQDMRDFHQTLKKACDLHDPSYYPNFKEQCDRYFYLPHREEHRGIGGVFFDYLGKGEEDIKGEYFPFVQDMGAAFMPAYLPIIRSRKDLKFSEEQKKFQLLRRGRYVEFNLIIDRGTKFGLETGGRSESILMSLPSEVHWDYAYQPTPGTPEADLIELLKKPRKWV